MVNLLVVKIIVVIYLFVNPKLIFDLFVKERVLL